jgi:hypothetical protein
MSKDPISTNKKLGAAVDACHPSYTGSVTPAWPGDPIPKITKSERAGGMAQVVDHLPSQPEAMSSNPSTTNRNEDGAEKSPPIPSPPSPS